MQKIFSSVKLNFSKTVNIIYRTYIIMKLISLFITQYQYDRLKGLVKEKGGKMSELIRRAIDEFLEKYENN